MKFQVNLDQRQVIRQVRGQSVRTLTNVKVEYVENHFPKALLLEFWRLSDEELPNELPELDRA
jgi:hypothetical protein